MTEIILDMDDAARCVVNLFRSAKTTIFYSSFVCVTDHNLPGTTTTMHQLTTEAVERGVSVHMFFNPSTQYGNVPMDELNLDPRVRIRSVTGNGVIPEPINKIFGDSFSNHHQKFLIVDGKVMMIGGVGVHPCRAGWLTLNTEPVPYYWHEIGVVTQCTPGVMQWVQNMWGNQFEDPPMPLMVANTEHTQTLDLIRTAKSCVHMEAQLCISTNSTANQVLRTVANRLKVAYETKGDTFRFIMLVNTHQPDEHPVISSVTNATLHWSRRMLMKQAIDMGVSPMFVKERVFLGTLEYKSIHIKVHSNMLIQDGHTMIRTSSNLSDRSLSAHPCDNELGVMVHGEQVAIAQQQLWKRYFMLDPNSEHMTPGKAFRYMRDETGIVRCVKYRSDGDTTFTPDFIVDAVMCAIHSLPYFGGKQVISWSTK